MDDVISRKGVFIPDITVEMFRNASLESIEDLMASGEMEDILLPSVQSDLEAKILAAGYTGKEVRIYIGGRLFGVRELAQ